MKDERPVLTAQQISGRIIAAIGDHTSIAEAQAAGVHVTPIRDWVVTETRWYAWHVANKMYQRMRGRATRCEWDDIESSAYVGLIEAVDCFDPRRMHEGRPIKIFTHLQWRIRKYVLEERQRSHWTLRQPSPDLYNDYMMNRLSPEEHMAYVEDFVAPVDLPDDDDYEDWSMRVQRS